MKKINKIKKILIIAMLIIITIGAIPVKSNAVVPIDSAYIYATRKTDGLLLWQGMRIHTHMAVYSKEGKEYPAYCVNRELPGVEIGFSQNVDVNDLINDVMVWRAIINGYPYKTIAELGCESEEEAYLATKQAVYCMLTNRDVSEYSAIGESGERTLNALISIVNNARNSNETKVSSELKINQIDSLWKIDNIDKNYMSQEFTVSANASINTYSINLENEEIEGVKIVDEKNNEKNEFEASERFKIIIPIKNALKDGSFNINVTGKVKTKPVLYGKSQDPSLQSYALTGYMYEDGTGNKKVNYAKNDTKIKIVKKDETGNKYLGGVEFDLLDSNKNVIYTGLTTDSNGIIEIENLLPGTYYLQEKRTNEGYELYEKLIEVKVDLHETSTVNVINNVEKPKVEIEKPFSETTVQGIHSEIAVKLPKTGY